MRETVFICLWIRINPADYVAKGRVWPHLGVSWRLCGAERQKVCRIPDIRRKKGSFGYGIKRDELLRQRPARQEKVLDVMSLA